MKILFFLSIGLDRQATSGHLIISVIERLCEKGHDVHIIQQNTGGSLPVIPKQLNQYSVTTDVVPYQMGKKNNFLARYLFEAKYIIACRKRIKGSFDAVFIQSTTIAGLAVYMIRKRLPRTSITYNVQDIFPYNAVFSGNLKKNGIAFRVLAAIQRYGYKNSDKIITISEDMKDTLVQDGTPPDKIEVIYNWSYQDEPYVNLDLSPISHMFNSRFFNVVYAGNIGIMQNVDILIEAAKRMKDDKSVWFHIIGDGVYKQKLEKRAEEYGIINISFWPMQPSELAPLVYSMADINVIPLVKDVYKTALPSKTATCLACGKPIIFAIGKDSKFGEIIKENANCILVDTSDPIELVNGIKSIRSQNNSMQSMDFFRNKMSCRINSSQYADIIVNMKSTESKDL